MRRLLTWLWLLPVPLSFALELLIGSGWLLILGNILAVAVAVPILIRTQGDRPVRTGFTGRSSVSSPPSR
ncbi:hypothetical protein [Brevibacterium spongiae]|uniref:YqaE/Pmp3 family membrane protein n=1 Tax=Brevibacterium spongiae TaxID=2909672 RepID=A0ABY5SPU7_9MICO|nr:hypothetical protein [Brevibacterium spongiae]UVI35076.1 hypothetical protein L1F31_13245 [Brevibacterium spongiae]